MREVGYLDTFSSVGLKLMLLAALFFPITTTMPDNVHFVYYQEFILVNLLAVLFLVPFLLFSVKNHRWNHENRLFSILFAVGIVAYQLFYFGNLDVIQWYWYGANALISFLFFVSLMMTGNKEWIEKHKIIEFTNGAILVSHILSILVYLAGYASVYWYNFQFALMPPKFFYSEKRYDWLYYHKSMYAFMVLLGLAFMLAHREKFRSKLTFALGVAVMAVCLYISHTNTAMVGGGLMIACFLADILWKNRHKANLWMKRMIALAFCAGVFGAGWFAFMKIKAERSIWTLGIRTYIWKATVAFIAEHPQGIGNRFAFDKIFLPELGIKVNNGHCIFFNEMIRFSLPVGLCFTALCILIVVYSMRKKFSLLTLGIWGALFMSVMMDYAVMISGWTLMFFYFYMIFFYDTGCKTEENQEEFQKTEGSAERDSI